MLKSDGWRVAPFIFIAVMLENLAVLSVGLNLFTYVFNDMHFSLTTSANIVTNFMGTTFLVTLVGGIISDVFLTKLTTICISGLLEILGLALLTISTSSFKPPQCPLLSPSCQPATGSQKMVLFTGLYLLALGSGGMKATLPPLGAEHFDESDPQEKKELGTYFNAYFVSFCVGTLGAVTFMIYIQEHISFRVGYGIAAGSASLALLVALSGYPCYKPVKRELGSSSPLVSILQVLTASFRNRKLPAVPAELLHGAKASTIQHTRQFGFLDKAATVSSSDFAAVKNSPWTLAEVEEVKIVLRIIPIFASTIAINCMIAQVETISVQQGRSMDRHLKHFEIPPASLTALPIVFIIVCLPIYDQLLVPLARRITGHETGITHLQRIGVGLVVATLSMVVAGLVERKRVHTAKEHHLLDSPQATVPLKIYWLTLQYFVLGLADMFTFVGLMEFFYRESPERIRSISTSLSFVSLSMGNFISSGLVSAVKHFTSSHGRLGWLPNNINRGKLTSFYYLLAIIGVANFVFYLVCANWYKYRQTVTPVSTLVGDRDSDKGVEFAPRSSVSSEDVGSVSMRPLIATNASFHNV